MDGYRVDELASLASWAEMVVTATGQPDVVTPAILDRLSSGTVLANAGHFPWEIDTAALYASATGTRLLDDAIERIDLPGGRHVILLAAGRMVNLAGREPKGNSLESMDLGFLLQSLSLERVATAASGLVPGAQAVPDDIDREIARRMLRAMAASE
jgi:adenosylhomocysteinase